MSRPLLPCSGLPAVAVQSLGRLMYSLRPRSSMLRILTAAEVQTEGLSARSGGCRTLACITTLLGVKLAGAEGGCTYGAPHSDNPGVYMQLDS
jgi:hypothetical protein